MATMMGCRDHPREIVKAPRGQEGGGATAPSKRCIGMCLRRRCSPSLLLLLLVIVDSTQHHPARERDTPKMYVAATTTDDRTRGRGAAASSVVACTTRVLNNTDCATTSYRITKAANWQACCALCTADGPAKCLNWVFACKQQSCHLRRNCSKGTTPKKGIVCGLVNTSHPQPGPSPTPPAPPAPPTASSSAPWSDPATFAIVGLTNPATLPTGLAVRAGTVVKHPGNPLMTQTEPWEYRLDNGYPNVVHHPGDPLGEWRLWYSSAIAGHNYSTGAGRDRQPGWLTANSSDGLTWFKPKLGLFNLSGIHCKINAELCPIGTANNIVSTVQGAGVVRDSFREAVIGSERFKGYFGERPLKSSVRSLLLQLYFVDCTCVLCTISGSSGGTAVSPDGLHWSPTPHDSKISFPRALHGHQAYDCHNNIVWDARTNRFLMTTRWYVCMYRCLALHHNTA
jgi:hypothetical protein